MLSTPWGAGETQGKEGPWVSAGFQEKPGRDITGERSGLCDPGPGRGKGHRVSGWTVCKKANRAEVEGGGR